MGCAGDPQALQPLVAIGGLADQVGPGGLRQIGEALSLNNRAVAFWGAWGTEMMQQQLLCGTDGNAALLAYCREQSPGGDGVYVKDVPVHQGIFVTDVDSLVTRMVASVPAACGSAGVRRAAAAGPGPGWWARRAPPAPGS